MAELDEKLAAMMADPNIMAQVAAMAKSLGMAPPGPGETPPEGPPKPPEGPDGPKPPPKGPEKPPAPPPSPDVLQRLAAMAGQSALDETRRRLLHALRPYVRPGWKTPCGPPSWPEPPRPCWKEEAMYNRYVPQGDGTYRRMDGAPKPPAPPPAPPGPPGPPLPPPDRPPRPPMGPPGPLGDLLSRWLPSGMDREDLLILLLILATSPDDSTAGLTVALYFALA